MRQYQIDHLIGTGGMGVVYQAQWLLPAGHKLPVACKLMRDERHAVPHYRELVTQEAVLSLQLSHNHPNLVTVLHFFEDVEERLCLVMELVEGGSMHELLSAFQQLPHMVIRRIAVDVLEALTYLHGHGVLHRDLSPCNILVSSKGAVKVSDLGLAKVMEQGQAWTQTFRGKPAFASPEALRRDVLDARADLYSLGAILYWLLTGGYPPCGDNHEPDHILDRSARGDLAPLPADCPQDLVDLTLGLLRHERADRQPQTAAEGLVWLRRRGERVAGAADLGSLAAIVARRAAEQSRRDSAAQALPRGYVLVPRVPDEPAPPGPGLVDRLLPSSARRTAPMPAPGAMPPDHDPKLPTYSYSPGLGPRVRQLARMAALGALLVSLGYGAGALLFPRGDRAPQAPSVPSRGAPAPAPAQGVSTEPVSSPAPRMPAPAPATQPTPESVEEPTPPSPAVAPSRPSSRPKRTPGRETARPWTEVPRVERTRWHLDLDKEPAQ